MRILTPESDILKEIPKGLLDRFPGVILVDLNHFTNPIPPQTIVVSSGLEPDQAVEKFLSIGATNLVQYNESFFLKDVESAATIISQPELFFKSLGGTVLGSVTKSKIIQFSSPKDKEALLLEASSFIAEIQNNYLVDSATIVLEELYMNAVFDARMESANKTQSNQTAKINLLLSEEHLVICCIDPYGSLNPAHFLSRLNEVYRKGAGNAIRMNAERGAGIGGMLLFEQCSSLYLGVKQNIASIVAVVIPRELGNIQRLDIKKGIHVLKGSA